MVDVHFLSFKRSKLRRKISSRVLGLSMQRSGVELVRACAVYGNHAFLGCCASTSWFGGQLKWKSLRLQSSRAATAN